MPLAFQADIGLAEIEAMRGEEAGDRRLDLKVEVSGHILERYEPARGALLGAYVARDLSVSGIRAFEADVGVSHAIFAYTMRLGEEYPSRWVLENLAAAKAPLITLLPPGDGQVRLGDVRLVEGLREFAENAGRFDVPLFVHLFPVVEGHVFEAEEYIIFFRLARSIFRHYAPNVALVWGFDAASMAGAMRFFPGRDAVDWIKLVAYSDVSGDGGFDDFFELVELFTLAYQREAPLMLGFGVSHFTASNHSYFTIEAAAQIEYIYERLVKFPRIKAVLYRNYNDIGGRGSKYAVHGVEVIAAAYGRAAGAGHFLDFVNNGREVREVVQLMRSPFTAVMRDYYFYIPMRALVNCVGLPRAYLDELMGTGTEIDGEMFFAMGHINRVAGADFFVDLEAGVLVFRAINNE